MGRPAHPSVLWGLASYQCRAPLRPKPPVTMAITQIRASTTATMNSQWIVNPTPKATIAKSAKITSSSIVVLSFPPSGIAFRVREGNGEAANRVTHVKSRAVDLTGKRAIVTGASSGIGRATARALAALGVRVAGGARRAARLETEIAHELDVTDPQSSARFVDAAIDGLGGLDILVNNAGGALGRAPFDESSDEDEAWVIGTNVAGLMRMTRLCLPHFADWGHIVNIGSVAGRAAYEGGASYITAKFAERGFTYALREDLLGRPIRVTTVDPGLVEGTEFSLVRFKGDEEKAAAVYRGVEPLQPSDVVDCILFALTRPWHVNVDEIVVKARTQSSGARILRDE